jgi:hypothetical protein
MSSAIFLKKIGSGMHSDSKFGWRGGGVSYIDAREKKIPEHHSSLCPSEKELFEQHSGLFCHKNILAYEHGEPWWNDSDRGNS